MSLASPPDLRVHPVNDAPVRSDGDYVLYWMIAQRRMRWNFGLQRAAYHASQLGIPLVVLEALRCDYRWASDRLHAFVLEGMVDNRAACEAAGVTYRAYVEPEAGAGRGLLEALAERAALVVTDEFPCFFLPHMVTAAGKRLGVQLEQVDANGILPLRAVDRVFTTAASFRRQLQKILHEHFDERPVADPLKAADWPAAPKLDSSLDERWPDVLAADDGPEARAALIAGLPIDHGVAPSPVLEGGPRAAEATLERFLRSGIQHYVEGRNQPDTDAASGLSPYLHFGHISAHAVFDAVAKRDDWTPDRTLDHATGSREGWWGLSAEGEAFFDELITWREVGYNMSSKRDDYTRFDSLPDFARETLGEHADDPREHLYDLETLDAAATHDRVWNAAQTQLLREGRMHNYLRMLWGKKVLEWSPSPKVALERLIELNNRYALDGRNPNSYSGIFWCLGRYDRAWGPERPIFGKVRFMSSDNTQRKLRLKGYLDEYAPQTENGLFESGRQ
jgi:deoxyribodipyrimidine photo-lyase